MSTYVSEERVASIFKVENSHIYVVKLEECENATLNIGSYVGDYDNYAI
jgi:hypothetical protein